MEESPIGMECLSNINDISVAKREAILILEAEMMKLEQVKIETFHHFSEGIYVREIRVPAGVLITGKIHKYKTLNMLVSGKMRIVTEDVDVIVTAPQTFISLPGIKKLGYAIEDSVFLNVLATDLTDIGEIEKHFVTNDYNEINPQEDKTWLLS